MDVWEEGPRYLIKFDNGLQLKVTESLRNLFNYMDGTTSIGIYVQWYKRITMAILL